jgi:hypothetical protein
MSILQNKQLSNILKTNYTGSQFISGSIVSTNWSIASTGIISGTFQGDGSGITGIVTGSANADTASYISPTFISASAAAQGFGNVFSSQLNSYVLSSSFNTYSASTDAKINSLTTATASYIRNSQTASLFVSASVIASTASYYQETDPTFSRLSGSLVTTSSFNAFTSSIQSQVNSLTQFTSSYITAAQTSSMRVSASVTATTASYYSESDPIFVSKSGSFATTGSNTFSGNQIISGTITLAGGARLTNEYDYHSIDIQAGPSGYVELLSNNTRTFIWITDENANIVTSGSHNWVFNENGTTTMPGGVTAPSFTGSLSGSSSNSTSSSYAVTASYAINTAGSFVTTSSFNSITGSFATTASLNAFTSSVNLFTSSINTFTASVQSQVNSLTSATSSYITNSQTSSLRVSASVFSNTASYYQETDPIFVAKSGSFVTTSSFNAFTSSINSFSGSIQSQVNSLMQNTSSYVLNSKTASFATTGSNTFVGNQIISGSLTVNAANNVWDFANTGRLYAPVNSSISTPDGAGGYGDFSFIGILNSAEFILPNGSKLLNDNIDLLVKPAEAGSLKLQNSDSSKQIQVNDSGISVTGDLNISNSNTDIQSTNVRIQDPLILIASGSNDNDAGIIVQRATNEGQALFNAYGYGQRWAIAPNISGDAISATPAEFLTSAKTNSGAPVSDPSYGGSTYGFGNIHIDQDTGDIYIYS